MHIAALFAHPDDLDLWAGGTALRHLDRGDRITSVLFYECIERRLAELEASRAFLPVSDVICRTAPFTPVAEGALSAVLGDVPDVVLTHWNRDVHREHRLVFECAQLFCQRAKRLHRKTPLLLMTSTYFMQGEAEAFEPHILVDVTESISRKTNAIRCHESQHPDRLLADVLSQNRIFGCRVGVDYAEGFVEYPLFGFTRSALRPSLHELLQSS